MFSGWLEKQDGCPGLWLAETFSTSPLKPLNGIQRNLSGSKISTSSTKFVFFGPIGKTRWPPWPLIGWDIFETSPLKMLNGIQQNFIGSKISTSSTKFVFFGPIGKTRWPPWPLIGWDIFDFSSETAERNSTKLDRKQDLNVLYQVCVFWADRKNKMAAWPLIGWDIFDFSSETAEWNSTKLHRKQDLNVLYQVCVFRANRKNKMAALASDWLRHFRLLLRNRSKEFNKTWQEARSQRPLPSLCILGRSEKQDGRPGLWLAETFSTSPLKPLNGIQRNLTGSKISTSSSEFVFFGLISKQKCPPWPTPQKGGTLYSGARYVALWASCWSAAPVKNRHKMHYHREVTCERDVTLADPPRKIDCSLGCKYLSWKFLLQIFFILHQLHFHANKVKFNAFLKIHIFLTPWFYYGNLPIVCHFLLVFCNYWTSANNFYGSS